MKPTNFDNLSFGEIPDYLTNRQWTPKDEKAESLGWKDPDYLTNGQWTPKDVDNTEEDAINFIKKEEGHNNV